MRIAIASGKGLPFAVVINRSDMGDGQTRSYCRGEQIHIVAEILDDRRVAEAYSRGELACRSCPGYGMLFDRLLRSVRAEVRIASAAGGGGPGA